MTIKRFFDFLITLIGTIITFPIVLIAAVLLRLDSSGPILFKQERVGRNGNIFLIYKLRTMVENADALGPAITAKNDTRVTQIGSVLRWLKIDELPQLWNVLKGDMSIIGPRPEVPKMTALYNEEEKIILNIKPGILGPSQISNRDEEAMLPEQGDVEDFYIKKVLPLKLKRDLAYVRNKDPFKDLKILFGGSAVLILSSLKFRYILESPRRFLFLSFDAAISVLSFWAAFMLRFEGRIPPTEYGLFTAVIPFIILFRVPCFIYFGLYQSLWQYLGTQELLSIVKAVTTGSVLIPLFSFILQTEALPRSLSIIDWFLLIIAIGASRIFYKITAERLRSPRLDSRKNVLIIGAEDTGELLVREFIRKPELGYWPVGFLDDDPEKTGIRIHGVKVLGKISQLTQVVKLKKTDEVIIALPKISGDEIKTITRICRELKLISRIMPQSSTILSHQIFPLRLRDVDVSDLLGRELVHADIAGIQQFFRGKRVLITGAGGSIGSELARIIYETHPSELVLIDQSENNLYDIETDLQAKPTETEVLCYLKDVTRRDEVKEIFDRHHPQIIYHAAAYKHVPLMELNYKEGITNNILGSKTMADLAVESKAECFVLISTDKAIRPRSVMGATKRIAELYTQSLKGNKTRFHAVRFGNVFNSKGSVVPLFKKQIEEGLPITVTDPEVKRYFMDVSEAVFLILQATILGTDSEIFMLDMGEPIKVLDLAREMAKMMGIPAQRLQIRYIGLRPGEKLEEELQMENEKAIPTVHPKIKIWRSENSSAQNHIAKDIDELLALIRRAASRDEIVCKVKEIVPEYTPWHFPS